MLKGPEGREAIESFPNEMNHSYRLGIVAIVLDKEDRVLLGRSAAQNPSWRQEYWEFPQGGVQEGESEEAAVLRELKEEIGTDRVEILARSGRLYHYDWRKEHRGKHGQEQRYFLLRLKELTNLTPEPEEFSDLRWVSWDHLRQGLRTFKAKREAYLAALAEFEDEPGRLRTEYRKRYTE